MIKPICDVCENELDDYGALLFSPPNESGCCVKRHICKGCYIKLLEYIDTSIRMTSKQQRDLKK